MPQFFGMQALLPKTIVDPTKLMSVSSGNSNAGTGQIQRNETVTLRLAGVVTQVLPNGNLVVAARQEFRVNNELRELQVTGVIRPQDIASDNTVLHDRMAEARIAYGGRGQLTDVQRPRWGQQVDGYSAAVLILAAPWHSHFALRCRYRRKPSPPFPLRVLAAKRTKAGGGGRPRILFRY